MSEQAKTKKFWASMGRVIRMIYLLLAMKTRYKLVGAVGQLKLFEIRNICSTSLSLVGVCFQWLLMANLDLKMHLLSGFTCVFYSSIQLVSCWCLTCF